MFWKDIWCAEIPLTASFPFLFSFSFLIRIVDLLTCMFLVILNSYMLKIFPL